MIICKHETTEDRARQYLALKEFHRAQKRSRVNDVVYKATLVVWGACILACAFLLGWTLAGGAL